MTSCLHGWVTLSASKPSSRRMGEDPADVGRLEAERGDVDGAVDVGQVVGRRLAHVQGGGERRAHAGADQAHEVGVLLHR